MNDHLLKARHVVATALGRPVESVEDTAAVGQPQGWDSLGHISIVLALEEEIGRLLRPDEIGQLKSVVDIATILSKAAPMR
jgi:acyl carrier protein